MGRLLTLVSFFLIIPLISYADGGRDSCGARPSALKRLLTDAEDIRLKCIDDYFVAQKEANARLATQVSEEIQKQKEVLKKSAYKTDDLLLRIHCDFPMEIPSSKVRTEQCRRELALYNGLIAQLDHIMGWDRSVVKPVSGAAEQIQKDLELPCPDEETLGKIQPVRYFKKNLYKIYERCRELSQ